MKEEFALRAVRQIISIFDLDFRLQTKCHHWVKPEHYMSQIERGVRITNRKKDLEVYLALT